MSRLASILGAPRGQPLHLSFQGPQPAFELSGARRHARIVPKKHPLLQHMIGMVQFRVLARRLQLPSVSRRAWRLLTARPVASTRPLFLRAVPVVYVLLDLILAQAVALLQLALQLVPPARDLVQIVVRELAPFFLDLAFELLPVSFDTIPIHGELLSLRLCSRIHD